MYWWYWAGGNYASVGTCGARWVGAIYKDENWKDQCVDVDDCKIINDKEEVAEEATV